MLESPGSARLRGAARLKALLHWGLRAGSRMSLWDADHIVPVVEGGGECDLQNIRTLCLKCHRTVTAELRARLQNRDGAAPNVNAATASNTA